MKYNIGDTVYWVEASTHYQKSIPCPMCFGKCFVTIILGDDSQEKIECGFCQKGYERACGIAKTWEASAMVCSGAITGVSSRDGVRYEVGYRSVYEHEIFTKEEAELVRVEKLAEVTSQAEHWFKESFVNAKKNQIWSAGYHRECIKREKRTIEWHELRLGMIKDKKINPITPEEKKQE